MPRQDIPGRANCLKIRHFLYFLLSFINSLPIFLESQDFAKITTEITKFWSLNYQKMMTAPLGNRRNYQNERSVNSDTT